MKKILFAAFAASLLAAGCQKTEIVGTTPVNGPAMTFSTEMKKITKADETTNEGTATLQGQGFNLWAYAAYSLENITNVDDETRIFDGMDGMKLTYSETGVWETPANKVYYWPGQGKDLRFFAVSPSTVTSPTISHGIAEDAEHTIINSDPSMTITDFVVNGTDDLMVADFLHQNQNQNGRVVELNFHHALSKVEFFFKATMPDANTNLNVYVQKLTVKEIANKGTLSVTTEGFPESGDTPYEAPVSLSWGTTQTGEDSFEKISGSNVSITNLVKVEDTDDYAIENQEGTLATLIDPAATKDNPLSFAKWLMLPQNITGKLVEIIYIIGDRQFKAVFPLDASTSSTTTLASWGINQYIKYTVNLSPNMITFDAKVETDWTSENGIDHIN